MRTAIRDAPARESQKGVMAAAAAGAAAAADWEAFVAAASAGDTVALHSSIRARPIAQLEAGLVAAALHAAAHSGRTVCLQLLIGGNADVDSLDARTGATALHVASAAAQHACMRILIGLGAAVGRQDKSGCTALHRACDSDASAVSYTHLTLPTICSV